MYAKVPNSSNFWQPNYPSALALIEARLAAKEFTKNQADLPLLHWAQETINNQHLSYCQKNAALAFVQRWDGINVALPQETLTALLAEIAFGTHEFATRIINLYYFMLTAEQKWCVLNSIITNDVHSETNLSERLIDQFGQQRMPELLQLLIDKLKELSGYRLQRILATLKFLLEKLNPRAFNEAWGIIVRQRDFLSKNTFFTLSALCLKKLNEQQINQLFEIVLEMKNYCHNELLKILIPRLSQQQIVCLFTSYYRAALILKEFEWGEYNLYLPLEQGITTLAANMVKVPDDVFQDLIEDCKDEHDSLSVSVLFSCQAALTEQQIQTAAARFFTFQYVNQSLLAHFYSRNISHLDQEQIQGLLTNFLQMLEENNPVKDSTSKISSAYEFLFAVGRTTHSTNHFDPVELPEEALLDYARVVMNVCRPTDDEKQQLVKQFKEKWGDQGEVCKKTFIMLLTSHQAVLSSVIFALSERQKWKALQKLIKTPSYDNINLLIDALEKTPIHILLDCLLANIGYEACGFNVFKRWVTKLPQTEFNQAFTYVLQKNNFIALNPFLEKLDDKQIAQIVQHIRNKTLQTLYGETLKLLAARLSSQQICELLQSYIDTDCQWSFYLVKQVTTLSETLYASVLQQLDLNKPILLKTILIWQPILSEQQQQGICDLLCKKIEEHSVQGELSTLFHSFNLIFKFLSTSFSFLDECQIKQTLRFALDCIKSNDKPRFNLSYVHEFIATARYHSGCDKEELDNLLQALEQCQSNEGKITSFFLSQSMGETQDFLALPHDKDMNTKM